MGYGLIGGVCHNVRARVIDGGGIAVGIEILAVDHASNCTKRL